jgi:hypothetical protein
LLSWNSRNGEEWGDSWFQTIEEAEAAAQAYFGIEPDQWVTGNVAIRPASN